MSRSLLAAALILLSCFSAWAQLSAHFSADTTRGCSPVTVQFSDQSSGSISDYYWTFGNGNTSTLKNPSAIFYKPGTYTVTLEVTDGSGAKDKVTKTAYIEVFELPTANFDPIPGKDKGCAPLTTPFSSKSKEGSAKITQVTWDFGDGNTSISPSGYHTYKVAGTYDVSMLVVDANKCEDKIRKNKIIEVYPTPEVDFEADAQFACKPPFEVNFSNKTKAGSGHTYLWDFGDGNTSTNENPKHTYTTNGTYTVKLAVTNSNGCKNTKTVPSFIAVRPLKVDFSVDQKDGCAPFDAIFTNKTDPDISGLSYTWDFGNGKKSYTKNAGITYRSAGTYKISLTVSYRGSCNQSQTYANMVTVRPSPEPEIGLSDTTACSLPFVIKANDIGSGANQYRWYLNGAQVNTLKNPDITVSSYGEHVISLVTENSYGCISDTLKRLVRAEQLELTIAPDTSGCNPLDVNFRRTSALDGHNIVSQVWDFGDGSSTTITDGNQTNVNHRYEDEGTYNVSLKVVTAEGCEGFANVQVKVGKKRPPQIESGTDTLCNAMDWVINNLSKESYKDSTDLIVWKLKNKKGDNVIEDTVKRNSYNQRWNFQIHTEDMDTGYYDVELVTMDRGCASATSLTNRIYILPPVAKLKPLHDTCANDIMVLANISRYYDSIHWEVNKTFYYDSIIRLGTDTAKFVLLRAFNDNSKCIDSAEFGFEPKQTFDGSFGSNGELCAPSSFALWGRASDSYLAYEWIVDGKDTFHDKNITVPFTQPGKYKVEYTVTDTSATGGCSKTSEQEIVITGPIVKGSIVGKPGCGPLDLVLKSEVHPDSFESLYWQIGKYRVDVSNSMIDTFELFQPGPRNGFWPITLVGRDTNGCGGQIEDSLEVYGTQNAVIKTIRFEDCSGLKYIFSPLFYTPVDETGWSYKWDMGDGSTFTTKLVNYTYKNPGKYLVRVYMTDDKGCVTRLQDTLDINKEVLKAKFFADSLVKDCPPLHVDFEDRSTNNGLRDIVKWEWTFGDGTTSQERYPSKLYLTAGKFDVSLKVTDEWGCEDSFNYPGFILVNGPTGDYVFDNTEGCVPLDVTFRADTARCSSFSWDLGDGTVIKDQLKLTHTYQDTGRFIPLLTLRDTFGCVYTRPPIDTIYVYPLPIPDFDISSPCPRVPTKFGNKSLPFGSITNCEWDFGDGSTSTDFYPNHTYSKGGIYPVSLKVTSRDGCSADTVKMIDIKSITADFEVSESAVCVGGDYTVQDLSTSDKPIVSWDWIFNDTIFRNGPNPKMTFSEVGPVKVQLIIQDSIGCTDTIQSSSVINVGDTIPPLPVDVLRVSVEDDRSYLIDVARSTAPDFKSYLFYHAGTLVSEEEDVDQTRFVNKNLNTLHNVYCGNIAVSNSCGLISAPVAGTDDCTVEVSAKSDTNMSRLSWNHYVGWNNVDYYRIYRSDNKHLNQFNLIDSVDGNITQYNDTNVLCYQSHWYRIEAVERGGNNQLSWSDTCMATPIYVNALPPNELVRATVQHDDYVRVEWLPTPYSKMPIDHYILEKSYDGFDYRIIAKNLNASVLEFDDRAVEVDSQSYFYRARAVDVCDDMAPYSNIGKTILLKADTGANQRPVLNWSTYKGWDAGVDRYEVQRKEADGSFFSLGYVGSNDTNYTDKITELNERPHYCYRVVGHRVIEDTATAVVSVSNEDCIDLHSWLFVPNAFSPNNDGLNDKFVTPGWFIRDYKLTIYNRWGEKLYESNSIYDNWDGSYEGKIVENEAYVYIIETMGIDLIKRNYKGTVTVVR